MLYKQDIFNLFLIFIEHYIVYLLFLNIFAADM